MNHRIVWVALVTVLLVLAASAVGALAQDPVGTKQVALVVAFPDGKTHVEIVRAPKEAPAIDVLRAAKVELASENTEFGPAVCGINQVGCSASNCFCDPEHFWAYYHLDTAAKAWSVAGEGVGAYIPADRSVEGFAWSGFDAAYAPTVQPPVYSFDEIVAAMSPGLALLPKLGIIALIGAGLVGLAVYLRKARSRAA